MAHQLARRPLSKVNAEPGAQTIVWVIAFLQLFLGPLTKRDWRNQHKLPAAGGIVVVVNHISNADPFAVGPFLAYSGRWPRFLAKASLFAIPVIGRIIANCGQIPVERGSSRSGSALASAVEAVRQGRALVIYPEGTITFDPELWPMAGRSGAARIALETGCPVIPIGQWGAQDLMYGKKLHFPKILPRKTFRLIVGDPVALDDLYGPLDDRGQRGDPRSVDLASERIIKALTVLVAELRQLEPPAQPFDPRATPRHCSDIEDIDQTDQTEGEPR